jgi:hypothetical protein
MLLFPKIPTAGDLVDSVPNRWLLAAELLDRCKDFCLAASREPSTNQDAD